MSGAALSKHDSGYFYRIVTLKRIKRNFHYSGYCLFERTREFFFILFSTFHLALATRTSTTASPSYRVYIANFQPSKARSLVVHRGCL